MFFLLPLLYFQVIEPVHELARHFQQSSLAALTAKQDMSARNTGRTTISYFFTELVFCKIEVPTKRTSLRCAVPPLCVPPLCTFALDRSYDRMTLCHSICWKEALLSQSNTEKIKNLCQHGYSCLLFLTMNI